eukprot:GHVU01170368.1.p1 GENE.GHVU01170368.1~~GHVU01170368.1.p1  ORF type:complete len:365 (-),score=19.66 GHVU01170368.1:708-1802(-)
MTDPLLDWAHTIGMTAFIYEQLACLDMFGAAALNICEIFIPDNWVRGIEHLCRQPAYTRTMKEGSAPYTAPLRGSPAASHPLPHRCRVGTDCERTELRDFGAPNVLMNDWADMMQVRFITNKPPSDFVSLRIKLEGNKQSRKRATRMREYLLAKELARQATALEALKDEPIGERFRTDSSDGDNQRDDSTPEPVTTEPTTPEPMVTEPAKPEPVTTEPITPEPMITEPATPEHMAKNTATPEPTAANAATQEPVADGARHSLTTGSEDVKPVPQESVVKDVTILRHEPLMGTIITIPEEVRGHRDLTPITPDIPCQLLQDDLPPSLTSYSPITVPVTPLRCSTPPGQRTSHPCPELPASMSQRR